MTDNHNYETPAQGSTGWNIPLNDNFRKIDTNIEIRDVDANRDQYTAKDGAKFLAVDTGTRYIGDGSQWTELPPQSQTRLTVRNLTSDPTDAVGGEIWYREDLDELRTKTGGSVETIASGEGVNDNDGGTALVHSSLDTMSGIDSFFTETQTNRAKVDAVSSPSVEGSGAMRINQPSKQRSEELYGGNEFYGTEGFHYLDDLGLTQCHIRYYAMLDENYDIDNPWGGRQAGKGFPGFDGRHGRDASDNPNPWLVNGAIWSGDEIGGSADDWILSFYLYDKKTDIGSSGRTYHPDRTLQKGRWYQIDRFVDIQNNELRQWYDGELVIDLDSSDVEFTPNESPYDTLYAIRNLFYYGGGWGAPDGSGDNHAYIDDIRVFDSEQQP